MGRRALIIANITFLAAGIALGIGAIKVKQEIQPRLPATPIVGPGAVQYEIEAQRQIARSQLIDGAVVFFGTSHTVGLPTSLITPNAENFGLNSDTLSGMAKRLPHYKLEKVCAVVIEVGTNDVLLGNTEQFNQGYGDLLRMIPGRLPVVAAAIFPAYDRRYASDVHSANRAISAACARRSGCTFLDANMSRLDANYDPDKIHLSARTTTMWAAALKKSIPPCR
jgi:lysophospholipase L1-like esterase